MISRITTTLLLFCVLHAGVFAQRNPPADGRFNFKIKEDVKGLAFITRLKPVTYQFDLKKYERMILKTDAAYALLKLEDEKISKVRRSGFIAQDVEEAATASGYNFNGVIKPGEKREHYQLNYESFIAPLVKSVQEQQEIITNQQYRINLQEEKIRELQKDIKALTERMSLMLDLLDKQKEERHGNEKTLP